MQVEEKYIIKVYYTGNDEVIFEEDTNEDEYMFFGEGMLNTILIFLHHYIAPSLIFVCYKSNQKRMRKWKLKSRKTRNFTILIRMILSTATYQRTHTCSKRKKIAGSAKQQNSSMNLKGYAAKKGR